MVDWGSWGLGRTNAAIYNVIADQANQALEIATKGSLVRLHLCGLEVVGINVWCGIVCYETESECLLGHDWKVRENVLAQSLFFKEACAASSVRSSAS